jgi:predicted O-linked N-acetylglucosamine transferase (SPINDLY family)
LWPFLHFTYERKFDDGHGGGGWHQSTRDAYIERAVELATDKARYDAHRAQLTQQRWQAALGYTPRFAREIEAAYGAALAAAVSLN